MVIKKKTKKRASTPRPYNAWTMSESEIRNAIIAKLRMLTRWRKPKQNCIKDSWGVCIECKKRFLKKELFADHISPVVPVEWWKKNEDVVFGYNWNEWIERAFKEDWWQALCKECHWIKTKAENLKRKQRKVWISI